MSEDKRAYVIVKVTAEEQKPIPVHVTEECIELPDSLKAVVSYPDEEAPHNPPRYNADKSIYKFRPEKNETANLIIRSAAEEPQEPVKTIVRISEGHEPKRFISYSKRENIDLP